MLRFGETKVAKIDVNANVKVVVNVDNIIT